MVEWMKVKYRRPGSNLAKKCGVSGDHNHKKRPHRRRAPAPVSRQRVKVLYNGAQIRWDG